MSDDQAVKGSGAGAVVLGWMAFLALLWFGFDRYFDARNHPNRGIEVGAGAGQLELRRNLQGH